MVVIDNRCKTEINNVASGALNRVGTVSRRIVAEMVHCHAPTGSYCPHVEWPDRRRGAAGRGRGHPLRDAESACREGRVAARGVTALDGGGCDDVVVVLGAAVVDVPPPARAVIADDWADGMSARCARACRRSTREFAVLHTVDTPDVGADVVRRVLDAARSSPSGLARARYGDTPRASGRDRAQALARAARGAAAVTKGRGRSCGPAPTSSRWTAPTWRPAATSTSGDRHARAPLRRTGAPTARRSPPRRRVRRGRACARRGHRVERHLGEHFAGGRLADRPRVAGVRRPLRGARVT